jgi:hypothetical protein
VTADKLDNRLNAATFDSGAVDGSTTALSSGAISVKDGGITSAKLAAQTAIDINGGAIDGTPIGANEASSGSFTTLAASGASALSAITCTTLAPTGNFLSGAGLGWGSSAGGSVTQTTSRTTTVYINKPCGRIITASNSLAALASATFTVTCLTNVDQEDIVMVAIAGGQTNKETRVYVSKVYNSWFFDITVSNRNSSTAETGAIQIDYAIIRGDV